MLGWANLYTRASHVMASRLLTSSLLHCRSVPLRVTGSASAAHPLQWGASGGSPSRSFHDETGCNHHPGCGHHNRTAAELITQVPGILSPPSPFSSPTPPPTRHSINPYAQLSRCNINNDDHDEDVDEGGAAARTDERRPLAHTPDLSDVLENNRKWVEQMKRTDPDFFRRIERGQNPAFLYIGCSDSRVPANQIMGLSTNEVFVHRNVANLVVNADINFQCVLHYAVEVLDVPHIIVCGHYDCGGVRAAVTRRDHGLVENWLRNIRDVYRLHKDELDIIDDVEARHRRHVEFNVMEQCLNVFKTGVVQKRRMQTFDNPKYGFTTPQVHGLVFSPGEGVLHKLPINFKAEMKAYQHIYDLYAPKRVD